MDKAQTLEFRAWRYIRDWYVWQVWLPLCCIAAALPAFCLVGDGRKLPWGPRLCNGFGECFSHGDLVLYSALLLLGVEIEIRRISEEPRQADKALFNRSSHLKFFSMLCLVSYTIVRCWAQESTGQTELTVRTIISLLIAIAAITYASGGMWLVYDRTSRRV
jgi:hypothetical protein